MTDKERLVNDNLHLVHFVLHTRYPTFVYDEDMFQIGCVGLVKAVNAYDESKGAFSTIAIPCIVNEIRMHFRKIQNYISTTSLNEIVSENGDDVTLEDLLPGFNDVELLDISPFYSKLTLRQKDFFTDKIYGESQKEIANKYGLSKATVSKEFKMMRKIWKKYMT